MNTSVTLTYVGTGSNACYMESLENVHQWDGDAESPRQVCSAVQFSSYACFFLLSTIIILQVIINTEWGAFGNSKSLDFVTTEFDRSVDQISKNPGKQM